MRAPAPAPAVAGLPPVSVPAPMGPMSDPPAAEVPPQPAPASGGVQQDGPASAPMASGPAAGAGELLALGPGRTGMAGRSAGIESTQAGADAVPPVAKAPTGQSGQRAGLSFAWAASS